MIRQFRLNEALAILSGIQSTIILSLVAFIGGGIVGLVIALVRTSEARPLRRFAAAYIDFFQGTPLLMQLFLVFYGLPVFGLHLNPWVAVTIGLTLHASAFLGEIWRGGIQAVPRGQTEAARALGLRYRDRMVSVVLPQAIRLSVSPTVGFMVQLIKGTSLAAIVGFTELTRAGSIVSNQIFEPLTVFAIVGALYFVLCWPLSIWGTRIERRLATATR